MIEINSYSDLRAFFINTELTGKQIEEIKHKTLNVFVINPLPKVQFIKDLDTFYENYIESHKGERPLFLQSRSLLLVDSME
jgi:succinate dehydrogenase/fumarate reductase-like Fe-S protein